MKQYFRITMLWLAVAMIAPMMTSCDEFFGLIDNPVTPALRVYTETLVVGEGHSLKINATTQDHVMLTYASSDPSVAIVDAEGNVIGVSEGKATITVTAQGDDDYYRNQIFGTNTHAVDVAVVKYDPTAIKLLADAQKEGALVSITFNLDGTNYIAYFRLVNGEYVLQDGPAATRAAARGVTRSLVEEYMEEKERRVWRTMTEGIELSLISILMGDEAQNSGSAGSGSTTPGTASTQNSVLMATWVDKETGNAIAQAQIDGATGETTMVQAATDVCGHAVEMKKVEVNNKTVHNEDDQAKASAAAGKTTGNESGNSGGGSVGGTTARDSNDKIAATKYMFTTTEVCMLVGELKQLEYTYSPSNAYIYFTKDNNKIDLIDNTGIVKANAAGAARIQIKTSNSSDRIFEERSCIIYIANRSDIRALYDKLGDEDGIEITSEMVSNINIDGLLSDILPKEKRLNKYYAKLLAEWISREKSLKNIILQYGYYNDERFFYVINGNNKKEFTYKSTAAIPSDWIGAKLFYVEKETASVGGGEN